ncbi:MAG TPA: branched-chain amino acid ABC transporter permease [Thermoleophilia bacterium]|nr:branched-chain amino acid ABC transporter permease [Thermoleophilia bacterium]HZK49422.1 branched-chain amino acid ABC transporter permease [Thermoleophilia bacterium]
MSFDQFLQYIVSGITNGSIYALTALGFTLIYNATDIINFAQGEFVMLGGLTAVSLHRLGLPLPVAFCGAVLIVMLVGIIFELLAIRPLLKASVLAQIIVTIGASLAFRTFAMIFWGRDSLPLPAFSGETPIKIFGARMTPQSLWVMGLTLVIVVALQLFYRRTLAGKAVRACSVNPEAARLMGISYSRVVLISFAVSAAISAAGGVLITPSSFMGYGSGAMIGLKGFAAAILGGLGSPIGAVLGGLALGVLESLAVGVVSAGYKDAVAFLILLAVLFVRPQGLMGQRPVEKV